MLQLVMYHYITAFLLFPLLASALVGFGPRFDACGDNCQTALLHFCTEGRDAAQQSACWCGANDDLYVPKMDDCLATCDPVVSDTTVQRDQMARYKQVVCNGDFGDDEEFKEFYAERYGPVVTGSSDIFVPQATRAKPPPPDMWSTQIQATQPTTIATFSLEPTPTTIVVITPEPTPTTSRRRTTIRAPSTTTSSTSTSSATKSTSTSITTSTTSSRSTSATTSSSSTSTSSAATSSASPSPTPSLSGPEIAGISVASLSGGTFVLLLLALFFRRRRRRRESPSPLPRYTPVSSRTTPDSYIKSRRNVLQRLHQFILWRPASGRFSDRDLAEIHRGSGGSGPGHRRDESTEYPYSPDHVGTFQDWPDPVHPANARAPAGQKLSISPPVQMTSTVPGFNGFSPQGTEQRTDVRLPAPANQPASAVEAHIREIGEMVGWERGTRYSTATELESECSGSSGSDWTEYAEEERLMEELTAEGWLLETSSMGSSGGGTGEWRSVYNGNQGRGVAR